MLHYIVSTEFKPPAVLCQLVSQSEALSTTDVISVSISQPSFFQIALERFSKLHVGSALPAPLLVHMNEENYSLVEAFEILHLPFVNESPAKTVITSDLLHRPMLSFI